MRHLAAVALGAAAWASPAVAHDRPGHLPPVDRIGWTLDPPVVLPLLLVLLLFLLGSVRIGPRVQRSRRLHQRRAVLFLSGWLLLAGALVSPLHEAGESSFTMHMIEHEIIMLPACLLLVLARPGPVLLWGLPVRLRYAVAPMARLGMWQALARPVAATFIQAFVLVAWHMPVLFDRALRSEFWHAAQHLSFVSSALLFWWAMLVRGRAGAGDVLSGLCLFATSLVGGGLGALMSFDTSPWYAPYAHLGMTPFGLSPAEDQQLAGLIMWIPGGMFHMVAALILLARVLRSAPEGLDPRVTRGH